MPGAIPNVILRYRPLNKIKTVLAFWLIYFKSANRSAIILIQIFFKTKRKREPYRSKNLSVLVKNAIRTAKNFIFTAK